MIVGIIGLGKMGKAIARALMKSEKVLAFDPKFIDEGLSVERRDTVSGLCNDSDVIILAVKPDVAKSIVREMSKETKNKTVISIAAGVSISFLEENLPKAGIVRAMPNIGCMIGEGAVAVAKGGSAKNTDLSRTIDIFKKTGEVFVVEEDTLDLVTAYSGAGPAYIALVLKLFMDAAVKFGLSEELSRELLLKTASGTIKLMQNGSDAETVMRMVATPGGVTEQGLKSLSEAKSAVENALESGMKRSKELGSNGD